MAELTHDLWMQSAIGKELSEGEARELFMISTRLHCAQNETLFEQGGQPEAFYLIVEGEVTIEKKSQNGKMGVITTLTSGSIVGEMGLLNMEKRSANARVSSNEATFLRIDWKKFQQLLNENHASAYKIIMSFARLLAGRLKRINSKVIEMQAEHAPGKGERLEEFVQFKKNLIRDWSF